MKPNYSLDDMRLFWLVAQAGSFRQAAEQEGVPPSTLSRRINALEQTLGLRLLHRDAHRINLTGTGRQYFERFGPLFNELDDNAADYGVDNDGDEVLNGGENNLSPDEKDAILLPKIPPLFHHSALLSHKHSASF